MPRIRIDFFLKEKNKEINASMPQGLSFFLAEVSQSQNKE